MLKNIFTLISVIAVVGLLKVSYDVYDKIDQLQTPGGNITHALQQTVDTVGLKRLSPYQRAVNSLAEKLYHEMQKEE